MARTGILRQVGIGFLALVSATMVLGGCNKAAKQEAEAAKAETNDWRVKYEGLETESRNKDAKIAEQDKRIAELSANSQPPTYDPNTPNDPVRTKQTKSTATKDTSSGGGKVFHLSGDILFDPGQTTLKAGAKKKLDEVASEIKKKYSGHNIRVEGHTDTDPIKKAKYASNEALSEARAESVKAYLASKGISASRIETHGYGASKPLATKAASRRVDIVVK